jgi:CheY-like chemotaxis protein
VAGIRVLVVDDNDANRELVTAVLRPFDIEVTEAADGPSAVAAAAALPVDVILMDVRMPGMDGEAAMQVIRQADGPNTDVPILAFSADATPENVRALIAAGFDGHVAKPVVAADLIGAIADWTSPHAERPERERSHG